MSNDLLRYEFPSTEKTRTFLRLSYLFKQLEWFAEQEFPQDHQAAIRKYFEIQEVTNRGDQKNDILQELERFRVYLSPLASSPNVDQSSLKNTLNEIQACRSALTSVGIRISHLATLNEFLKLLAQRSSIPAGTCEFDLPIYHHWLNLPAERRKADLQGWITPLKPYHQGIDLILKLLRGSAEVTEAIAEKGGYQKDLQGKTFTLLQIYVDPKYEVVPKVSANRYMLSVRFIPVSFNKPAVTGAIPQDIPFKLGICNI